MRNLDLNKYDSDKKLLPHYMQRYYEVFGPIRNKKIKLLELGIYKGGSLCLWRDFFKKGIIVGLDMNKVSINDPTGRIRVYQGLQQNTLFLDSIAAKESPEGFDIIIDDCSHVGEFTRISFWHLFCSYLKPGGIYVIEDWGTGYWDSFFDGRHCRFYPGVNPWITERNESKEARRLQSHDYGMVGFIKELIDECGIDDITNPELGLPPHRSSIISGISIYYGQVFVTKTKLVSK